MKPRPRGFFTMRPRAGTLEIICCTLAWGTIGSIVNRISLASSVIVFFRLAFGFVVVLGWLAVRKRLGDLRLRARPVLLIASGLVLGVHWALLFAAYKRIGVDTTILIVFIGPVLWAVAAPFFLRERLRASSLGALAVAFGGIALISIPKIGSVDGLGLAAALGSAVLFAVLILMGKLLTEHYEPAAIVVWQLGVAAVLLSPALAGASVHQIGRGLPLLLVLSASFSSTPCARCRPRSSVCCFIWSRRRPCCTRGGGCPRSRRPSRSPAARLSSSRESVSSWPTGRSAGRVRSPSR
ncbi:MAG: hypothetical protein E6G46_09465 [Actinobacteria bacterium]|nr:MAG: hypothetical protein E6G46_09465 [Actinomycetota bacterium]